MSKLTKQQLWALHLIAQTSGQSGAYGFITTPANWETASAAKRGSDGLKAGGFVRLKNENATASYDRYGITARGLNALKSAYPTNASAAKTASASTSTNKRGLFSRLFG